MAARKTKTPKKNPAAIPAKKKPAKKRHSSATISALRAIEFEIAKLKELRSATAVEFELAKQKQRRRALTRDNVEIEISKLLPPYSISEWCMKQKQSKPTFWNRQRQGLGPRLSYDGGMPRITAEAEIDYNQRLNAGELQFPSRGKPIKRRTQVAPLPGTQPDA